MKIAALIVFSVGCSTAGIGLDADDASDVGCAAKTRLVGGACVAADGLMVHGYRSQRPVGSFSNLSACFTTLPGNPAFAPPDPVASDGPCLVRVHGRPGPAGVQSQPPPDAGRIVVRGAAREVLTFVADSGPCYANDLPPFALTLSGGMILEASGEGGADYPAFAARVGIPADVVIDSDELRPARPAEFRWRAGDARRPILLTARADDGETYAELACKVPDSGSYTAPAALMQHFPATATSASVSITRSRSAHFEPAGIDRVIDVTMTNESIRLLRYVP